MILPSKLSRITSGLCQCLTHNNEKIRVDEGPKICWSIEDQILCQECRFGCGNGVVLNADSTNGDLRRGNIECEDGGETQAKV